MTKKSHVFLNDLLSYALLKKDSPTTGDINLVLKSIFISSICILRFIIDHEEGCDMQSKIYTFGCTL